MRKLRMDDGNSKIDESTNGETPPSDRKLRVMDTAIEAKIDRLLALKTQLSVREETFKRETKSIRAEIDDLQQTLLVYGRDNELERISTASTMLEYVPRVSRKIDPKGFLQFLKAHDRTNSFYEFIDVPITNAIKHFGEAVLESSGVLTATVKDYAGMKVSAFK